jgi:hypothetical protein
LALCSSDPHLGIEAVRPALNHCARYAAGPRRSVPPERHAMWPSGRTRYIACRSMPNRVNASPFAIHEHSVRVLTGQVVHSQHAREPISQRHDVVGVPRGQVPAQQELHVGTAKGLLDSCDSEPRAARRSEGRMPGPEGSTTPAQPLAEPSLGGAKSPTAGPRPRLQRLHTRGPWRAAACDPPATAPRDMSPGDEHQRLRDSIASFHPRFQAS